MFKITEVSNSVADPDPVCIERSGADFLICLDPSLICSEEREFYLVKTISSFGSRFG